MDQINLKKSSQPTGYELQEQREYLNSFSLIPLLGGPRIPLGPPLDPRGPRGEPRLRGCIDEGPRRPDDSN